MPELHGRTCAGQYNLLRQQRVRRQFGLGHRNALCMQLRVQRGMEPVFERPMPSRVGSELAGRDDGLADGQLVRKCRAGRD